MVSGDTHSPLSPDDIQAMSDEQRESLVDAILANSSTIQLENVISKAQRAKREREETERKELEALIARYKPDAIRLGLEVIVRRHGSGKSGAHKPKSETQARSKGRKYPPGTYRNPETNELWVSGRRPPLGISKAVAAGHNPREFLVRDGEEAAAEIFPEEE